MRYVGQRKGDRTILMPNPFYPAYGAGARAAGCEAIYLPTTLANGFLPDLDALNDTTWPGRWLSTSPRRPIRKEQSPHANISAA